MTAKIIGENWSERLNHEDRKECKNIIKNIISKINNLRNIQIHKFIELISKDIEQIMNGDKIIEIKINRTSNTEIDAICIDFIELFDDVFGSIKINIGEQMC